MSARKEATHSNTKYEAQPEDHLAIRSTLDEFDRRFTTFQRVPLTSHGVDLRSIGRYAAELVGAALIPNCSDDCGSLHGAADIACPQQSDVEIRPDICQRVEIVIAGQECQWH